MKISTNITCNSSTSEQWERNDNNKDDFRVAQMSDEEAIDLSLVQRIRDEAISSAVGNQSSRPFSPVVSVIVPVFDVEKYLRKCLDSLIGQQLKEIEIICVNDASPDRSGKILASYAKADPRILVVNHQANLGLGASRNTGLQLAVGKYVVFVDSDDWVSSNMLGKLLRNASQFGSDMVLCAYQIYDDANDEYYHTEYHDLYVFDESFDRRSFHPSETAHFLYQISVTAWAKLYRKSFLERVIAQYAGSPIFPERKMIFEDNPAFFKVFPAAEKISLVRERLGCYRVNRANSLIGGRGSNYGDCILSTRMVKTILEKNGLFEKFRSAFFNYQLLRLHMLWYAEIQPQYKSQFFKQIKQDIACYDLSKDDIESLSPNRKLQFIGVMRATNDVEFEEYLKSRGGILVEPTDHLSMQPMRHFTPPS